MTPQLYVLAQLQIAACMMNQQLMYFDTQLVGWLVEHRIKLNVQVLLLGHKYMRILEDPLTIM